MRIMKWLPNSTVITSLIIASALCGCTTIEPPVSPISKIPMLLLDYIEEKNTFIVYLHSSSGDIRYDNMSIHVSWSDGEHYEMKNDTYALYHETNETKFYLKCSAYLKSEGYEFECNVSLENIDDEVYVFIQYFNDKKENLKKVKIEDLPWTKMLERMEKWQ